MILKTVFILIALCSLILCYLATGKEKRLIILSLIWLTIVGTLGYLGFFEDVTSIPPRFILVLLGGTVLVIYLFRLIDVSQVNTKMLLLIHGLRLPVELSLHQLYVQKQIPEIMTYEGWNLDIVMGVTALLILAYIHFTSSILSKRFMLIWNIMGIIMLLIIVVIAILSSPLPIQMLGFEQPNVGLLKFPYILLPAYIVPIVFLSHFLSIKKLLNK